MPARVAVLNRVTKISAGGSFVLALRSDGTVWGWGRNYIGVLGGTFESTFAPVQIQGLPPGIVRLHTHALMRKIVQTPTLIVFLYEGNTHSYRQIFMDGRKHPAELDPTWFGHSIGWFEGGDTLVIDTVGFNEKQWIAGGLPQRTPWKFSAASAFQDFVADSAKTENLKRRERGEMPQRSRRRAKWFERRRRSRRRLNISGRRRRSRARSSC